MTATETASTLIRPCADAIRPDPRRTVLRPFHVEGLDQEGQLEGRTVKVARRVLSLPQEALGRELAHAMAALRKRHPIADAVLQDRATALRRRLSATIEVDQAQSLLIAAFLTEEFSIETAALFNPSVVPHHDQTGLGEGETQLILTLRGIGEGHVSSLVFQTGIWHADGTVSLDTRGERAIGPEVRLPKEGERTAHIDFPDVPLGERVVYPFLPSQGRGIEDVRFCRFVEEDGAVDYRATFTAFDGSTTRQAALVTRDFRRMVGRRLDGDLAYVKGAAWFPRRIDGRYYMLARLDGESIAVVASHDPDHWTGGTVVVRPRFSWEVVQMGNCGSPIEIEEGWLVLTHGVGEARTYRMGAVLLDRHDPARLLARTPQPILAPDPHISGGYVPNVVYSCGGLVRGRTLLLPYGIADQYSQICTIEVDRLLAMMT